MFREVDQAARDHGDADVSALEGALESLEYEYFNNMLIVLDGYFVHRLRGVEGKDGNALNEVRVLARSLMEHGGTVTADPQITLDPATIPGTISETVDGGPGNDYITGANTPGTISGGSGNDALHGRGTLNGDAGNDLLMGSPLADNLNGGSGRDRLDGGFGADDIAGGSGADTLEYSGRVNGVNVTIGSGKFNDGGPEDQTGSRRDTVHGDVEVQYGTESNDVLIGDRSPETLVGLGGDDFEVGNGGGDTVFGGPGDDRLFGKSGNDRLAGGPDDDFLRGGTGLDVMQGKNGIDRINARDGARDVKISCGPGPNRLEGAKWDGRLDPRPRSC